MLPPNENNYDINEQNNHSIATENEVTSKNISVIKKAIIILVGIGGLFIFSILGTLIAKSLNLKTASELNGATNFITYAFLFVTILAIINKDILKLKFEFKKWMSYLIGFGFGVGMIVFPIVYNFIVNLFYKTSVNENEGALRSFIVVYPVISIIFLGFIGPICEEFTYRVGVFGILKKPKWLAYVIGTIVFALAHFSFTSPNIYNELINLPVYLVSGFLLCLAYDKFGLAASLTAHIVNNVYSVGMVIILNYLNGLVS